MTLFPSTRPAVNVRVLPRLPANVTSTGIVTVERSGGTVTLGYDTSGQTTEPNPLDTDAVLFRRGDTYQEAPLSSLRAMPVALPAVVSGAPVRNLADKNIEIVTGKDLGLKLDGTDDSTGWNRLVSNVNSGALKAPVLIGPGSIRLGSKPAQFTKPVTLIGGGVTSGTGTIIIGDFARSGFDAIIDMGPGSTGFMLSNVNVQTAAGRTGGCALRVVVDDVPTGSADYSKIDNVVLTPAAGGTGANTQNFLQTFRVDGALRTTEPRGVRTLAIRDLRVFGSSDWSVYMGGVVGVDWFGGGIYPAGGPVAAIGQKSGGIQFTGTSGAPSVYINMRIHACNAVDLSFTDQAIIEIASPGDGNGGIFLANTSTVTNTRVLTAQTPGTIFDNWARSCEYFQIGGRKQDGASGWRRRGNELEQWLEVTVSGTGYQSFAWPTAFKVAPFSVVATPKNPASSNTTAVIGTVATTTFTAASSVAGTTLFVRAYGY